jgi:hypothetical protein
MAGNSNSGGARKNAGRKSHASKLLAAGFVAPWFTEDFQKIKWLEFINSDDPKIALDACKYISDRLFGKAAQAVDMNHSGSLEVIKRVISDL